MTENVYESTEKLSQTGLLSRIQRLSKPELTAFCSFVGLYGANFYTVRDKLLYSNRDFRKWEIVGIDRMVREFKPGYEGELKDFFERVDEKVRFVRFMEEEGDMSPSSCYQRFKVFNFKKWEIIGLYGLLDIFLKEHLKIKE